MNREEAGKLAAQAFYVWKAKNRRPEEEFIMVRVQDNQAAYLLAECLKEALDIQENPVILVWGGQKPRAKVFATPGTVETLMMEMEK